MKISFSTLLSIFFCTLLNAQSLPIAIDSQFDDWEAATLVPDAEGDGAELDLLGFEVANDEEHLFLRILLNEEIILTEGNSLRLYLDTDNNSQTGKYINGIGAELEINFGGRYARIYTGDSNFFASLNDIQFNHQPTVSSRTFEMAIAQDAQVEGVQLFNGNKLRILFRDGTAGDLLPDAGQVFSYSFDPAPTPPFQAVDLQKNNSEHIRLLTWNTLDSGLGDFSRRDNFKRVISVVQPDIVTFNECWNVSAGAAATLLNEALPLGNFQSWSAVKLDGGNITVTRFPILQSWLIRPGSRLTASLIDLPDEVCPSDLLVVNGHLKCCSDGDDTRQLEADAFAAFILDAKSPGGVLTLPEGTPFVLSGDLNLVGWAQQLNTLLTGDIVNTSIYGAGGAPDWDGGNLTDVVSWQADQRMAYTWRSYSGSYPPSRLDYHIFSGSAMEVEKAFILQTEIMSPERLAAFGLLEEDTYLASDHLPKVTDFKLKTTTATNSVISESGLKVWPNPVGHSLNAQFFMSESSRLDYSIVRSDGTIVRHWATQVQSGQQSISVELDELAPGFYLFQILSKGKVEAVPFIKK